MREMIGDLERLLTTVNHRARSQAQDIKQEAEDRARQVRNQARETAEREKQRILNEARAKARQIARERAARTTREERDEYLSARAELLQEVLDTVESRLREVRENPEEYCEILHALALEALSAIGPGTRVLSSDKQGHELLSEDRLSSWAEEASGRLGKAVELTRKEEPADTWGGLVVADKKGRRTVDATFATRMALAADELREHIARRLESQHPEE
jgi:vacuolar-type H+-ATPase subunit E/Vma4